MSQLVREAIRDGQRVVLLTCYDGVDVTIVEAQITPVGSATPVSRGPYRFATAHDAFRFVQEALLALQYLGCTIAAR